ncbi:MAG TPA: recombinase family protein [Lachnoclostridium phytofermentans]|uniref:Recombinase family protein n=1 Tax=Lachnoclostridium phytofermentans TaxID=66219 RepID=A0A3D2X8H5_9FIRM|nr:recombinase family protein [Lachnoclostridium sp.]HCL03286.1 recombinase family protein [Lachnoclostridium phytofermentans]
MREGKRAIIYTRVSTEMQVDGFSLEGQLRELKGWCEFEKMNVVGIYEEKGKSAKSIEGRPAFQEMMNDIKESIVECDYICVYKLSRFGRNAADILNSLEFIQSYGVNLLCKEDMIDSSQSQSKLLISVLGGVSEMERENIITQSMNGRREKAKQGGWNGGFAPFGYQLEKGELIIVEKEAEIVKYIYEQFVYGGKGYTTISKMLNLQKIEKRKAVNSNRIFSDWSSSAVKHILDNPLYCGKLTYGRRKKEKIQGTRNSYRTVKTDKFISVQGKHQSIITEELFELATIKRKETGHKFESSTSKKVHLLTGILKCPHCGSPMYINKNSWTNKDGSRKEIFYYTCGHNKACKGGECSPNSVRAEYVEEQVIAYIKELVKNAEFAKAIQERIGSKIDTTQLDKELFNYKSKLSETEANKRRLEEEIDNFPLEISHRERKLADKNSRIDSLYDIIEELESKIDEVSDKKMAVENNVLTMQSIYKILLQFDKIFDRIEGDEQKKLLASFVNRITLNEGEKIEQRTLKSIVFNFAIPKGVANDKEISLDNNEHVETCCLLYKVN